MSCGSALLHEPHLQVLWQCFPQVDAMTMKQDQHIGVVVDDSCVQWRMVHRRLAAAVVYQRHLLLSRHPIESAAALK